MIITPEEQAEIILHAQNPPEQNEIINEHIREVNAKTKGWSILCDFTKTSVSSTVAKFQGDSTLVQEVPDIYHRLAHRIADKLHLSSEHLFFQLIVLGENGKVSPHYDAGLPGYITYKCNIYVQGPPDVIFVDKNKIEIQELDLYHFEANLYKHWMEAKNIKRIHLSYGFLIPYKDLGWDADSPRVRLSNKIWKFFQKDKWKH